MSTHRPSHDDRVHVADTAVATGDTKIKSEMREVERVFSPDDLGKDHQNYDRIDTEVAKYATDEYVEVSDAESRRLRKMIDKRVLFIMVVTYFLQALDKGTMSFTSIMGIRTDLDLLDGQKYPWLTTCIYIAVLVVEYPTNWIIQRVPIAKYLSINILLWSTTLALHAVAKNFTHLVVLRTLLGIFEAVCQPTFLVMSAMWYKREEQAETITFWYMMNGAQQIVGGLLAYGFSTIGPNPHLKSWQAIFLTYGAFSFLWGIFVFFWLPDSPMRAKCFTEEEKKLMVERVRTNQTGLQNRVFRRYQVKEALMDYQCWAYFGIQLLTTLPTSGLGGFYGIVVKGFGFTTLQTQLLAMVLGAFIIIILLSSTWLVKRTQQNLWVMLGFIIPSFVGTIVLMTVKNTTTATKAGLLISYYIVLSFWAAQGLGMSMLSRNVAGSTKKSVAVAMNFIGWCTGNAIGPQVFLDHDGPRYFIAFSTHMGCYVVLVFVILGLRWHLTRINKQRDAIAAAGVHEANDQRNVHAFEDLTDKENVNFRYVF